MTNYLEEVLTPSSWQQSTRNVSDDGKEVSA